jgi:hypothetical protein
MIRIQFQAGLAGLQALLVFAGRMQDEAVSGIRVGVERIEFDGQPSLFFGLLIIRLDPGQVSHPVPGVGLGILGIALDGSQEVLLGVGPVPFTAGIIKTQRAIGFAERRIQLNGGFGRLPGFAQNLAGRQQPVKGR